MERIYMDYSATTPLRKEVLEAMMPYMTTEFGNPSSIRWFGRNAKKAMEDARARIATAIGAAEPGEVIFTSGGSEADNLAIWGVMEAYGKKHLITSAVEHHAVLDTARILEKEGYDLTVLPVDEYGMVDPEAVRKAIRPDTGLVTVMYGNNEIGTVEPVGEIASVCREKGVFFHTDAVQAVGHIPVNVKALGVDLMSFAAHKFYGPKGIGGLYVRKGIRLEPQITGGAQERKRRAGTENVAYIVGMAKALELAVAELPEEIKHLSTLRDRLIKGLMERIPEIRLNGHPTKRLPGNVNISYRYVEGESLLLHLDINGIAASSGSACTSGSLEPSHVLMAIGLSHEIAHGSVRMSLGKYNTEADIDKVLEVFPGIVAKLREMSPLYIKTSCARKEICDESGNCSVNG
ncbi:MAG TPA: cysteine desulfurase NifS [Bacillota bacterium]|mgnify:FL=1|nr:cysteine desulfurase NifS [Bacillota bacterium]